jgi:hypothetical protein
MGRVRGSCLHLLRRQRSIPFGSSSSLGAELDCRVTGSARPVRTGLEAALELVEVLVPQALGRAPLPPGAAPSGVGHAHH